MKFQRNVRIGKMKKFIVILFVVTGFNAYSQFAENEFDIGASLNFRYDFFNSFDNFPALELRYNRSILSFGVCLGHNRNELTASNEVNNIDGIYLNWNYRLNKEKKVFDSYFGLFFNTEKYYYTYINNIEHQLIYDESGITTGIDFYETWNLKNGFYVLAGFEAGYSYSGRELRDATTVTSKTADENDPCIALHIGLKYSFLRFPRKKENNRTF